MTDDLDQRPPAETPPAETPPADTPPADTPAVPTPSNSAPPIETAPSAAPPPDASPHAAETSEGADLAAGTQPVVGGGQGSNRLRWAVGIGVAALAVIVAIGAFIVLGSRPAPEALKYIPGDSAVVVEIRPDLPGDQLQKLGNLLAHFPGFKDQSTLSDKLDESLAKVVGQASDNQVSYETDVKPWLSGPAFLAFRPDPGASPSDPAAMARGVISLSTNGAVSCDALFKGKATTGETYRGLDLTLAGSTEACVIDGRQALIGDAASVRAAIDAHTDGTGLDRSATYQQARASLPGDQLAAFFIDGSAYTRFASTMVTDVVPSVGSSMLPSVTPPFPQWLVAGFRAEDDAIVLDSFSGAPVPPSPGASPGPSLLPNPAAHPSVLLPMAPAGTLLYVETQGAGVALQNMVSLLRTDPQLGAGLQILDGAGGAGQLLGWIDDAGVIVVNGPDGPAGGLLLAAKDEQSATDHATQLLGLIAVAGFRGGNVQTSESTIGGVKVTTVTIADVGALVPSGELPPGVSVPADAKVEFSIAAKGKVLVLGSGEAFMNAVLTVQPGSALTDQDLYKQATARDLPNSQVRVFVGIRDIVSLAEKALPAGATSSWETELKPYLAPFEAFSLTSAANADSSGHARFTLTIGNP